MAINGEGGTIWSKQDGGIVERAVRQQSGVQLRRGEAVVVPPENTTHLLLPSSRLQHQSVARLIQEQSSGSITMAIHQAPSVVSAAAAKVVETKQKENATQETIPQEPENEKHRDQLDVWSSIQASMTKNDTAPTELVPPYVHPLIRRSASFMSQTSLEICTESLGSETGSDGFSDMEDYFYSSSSEKNDESEDEKEEEGFEVVKYSFPPPLPSISREIRAQRRDGRVVMEAAPLSSKNYLCCQRQEGRLLLSFVEPFDKKNKEENSDVEGEVDVLDEEDVEEEEEEVEVVDRGIVVEVKMHRSTSFVINKFVSGIPLMNNKDLEKEEIEFEAENSADASELIAHGTDINITTGVAAQVVAFDQKKVVVANRREALLQQVMRRCSLQQDRPLFIWEPCFVAAT